MTTINWGAPSYIWRIMDRFIYIIYNLCYTPVEEAVISWFYRWRNELDQSNLPSN